VGTTASGRAGFKPGPARGGLALMNDAMKQIASFLSHTVFKPFVIIFFSVYHAAFMLAAPVICARLSLRNNPVLRDHALAFFRGLFPETIGGAGLFLAVAAVLASIAYAILVGAIAIRIPFAIIKWNIAHLADLLYGNALRSLPYVLMMIAPALYTFIELVMKERPAADGLMQSMIIPVVSQYGAISLVAIIRSAHDLIAAKRGDGERTGARRLISEIAKAFLPALAVLLLAGPLLALAAASYYTGAGMHSSPGQSILFHVTVFLSMAGAVGFYLRHYDEYLALLVEDDEGEG
jgi:hypothetical protein